MSAMGYRLSKIVTRTGDAGTTGLGDGSRVAKDSLRIAAVGDTDELNSQLGVLLCEKLPEEVRALLTGIQHDLFDLGSELAVPGSSFVSADLANRLEAEVDRYNGELPPLREFILAGGTPAAAQAHLARAVCRRAERSLVALGAVETVSDSSRRYLNRLSDLLFVLGRWLNKCEGGHDVLWQKGRNT
jgi:cob(I)alamin adenosyltransferase